MKIDLVVRQVFLLKTMENVENLKLKGQIPSFCAQIRLGNSYKRSCERDMRSVRNRQEQN